MCTYLKDIDNLYSISFDDSVIDASLSNFISNLISQGFGFLNKDGDKIITLPPVLNLQNNWEGIIKDNAQSTSRILNYLSVLTIFLGGKNSNDNELYLQTEYPIPSREFFDFQIIADFLKRVTHTYVKDIRFVISDLVNYPNINSFLSLIASFGHKASLYISFEELSNPLVRTMIKSNIINVVVLYHNTYPKEILFDYEKIKHRFLIDNENDYSVYTEYINCNEIHNYDFVPVYNGNNRDFIVNNLFLTQEEILRSRLTKRHIYMHQALNVFSFGHLFILPSGKVYSDLTKTAIGSIKDTIHSLILAEQNANISWRRTRRTNGCKGCLLVDICPSPTKLENLMGIHCICANPIN
jgi:pseudo-rSAM protein